MNTKVTITPIPRCPSSPSFLRLLIVTFLSCTSQRSSVKDLPGWVLLFKSLKWCFKLCPNVALHPDLSVENTHPSSEHFSEQTFELGTKKKLFLFTVSGVSQIVSEN